MGVNLAINEIYFFVPNYFTIIKMFASMFYIQKTNYMHNLLLGWILDFGCQKGSPPPPRPHQSTSKQKN